MHRDHTDAPKGASQTATTPLYSAILCSALLCPSYPNHTHMGEDIREARAKKTSLMPEKKLYNYHLKTIMGFFYIKSRKEIENNSAKYRNLTK